VNSFIYPASPKLLLTKTFCRYLSVREGRIVKYFFGRATNKNRKGIASHKVMKSLFLTVTIALGLTGCGTQYRAYSPSFGDANDKASTTNENTDDSAGKRIVIYNATLTIVIKNPDSANSALAKIAEEFSGYVSTLGNKSSTIRVKADKLNEAITEISKLGKIKEKVLSGNDVTDEYKDYEIRLDNANKARARYLELLSKAENVEAALKVEKELERLNGEIDLLEGKLKRLKHLREYSTITIYLNEKTRLGVLGYVVVGLYEGVKWLFIRN